MHEPRTWEPKTDTGAPIVPLEVKQRGRQSDDIARLKAELTALQSMVNQLRATQDKMNERLLRCMAAHGFEP